MAKFQKGHRKIPGSGTQAGVPRKRTLLAREFSERIIYDEEYQQNVVERAKRGRLHPAVEVMIWHYGYGKPVDRLEVTGIIADVSKLSDADLIANLQRALRELTEASSEQPAIDVEARPALPAPVEEPASV